MTMIDTTESNETYRLEAIINIGGALGEPTVTWTLHCKSDVQTLLRYLTDTLNPMNISWCSSTTEVVA